jgi:hypothetical protein
LLIHLFQVGIPLSQGFLIPDGGFLLGATSGKGSEGKDENHPKGQTLFPVFHVLPPFLLLAALTPLSALTFLHFSVISILS